MNYKQIIFKTLKGALSGVAAVASGVFAAGLPMDRHAAFMAIGALGSAAIHGAWNVLDQYLAGATVKE